MSDRELYGITSIILSAFIVAAIAVVGLGARLAGDDEGDGVG
jgi:hypothetical protein